MLLFHQNLFRGFLMKTPVFANGNGRAKKKLLELRREAHHDKQPRIALRIQGILLSLDKRTTTEIADTLKVNRTTIPLWIKNWNEYGEDGLMEGMRSGRPSFLNEKQLESIHDIVESGPVSYGLNTGIWTSILIRQIIEDEFGISYHAGHVRKLLHKIGFSVQRPTVSIVTGDPENKRKWLKYRHPNLKKKRVRKAD